jgi:hypothetical protein
MFGYRPDGILVRGIDPIQKIIPHIMTLRYDAQNMTHYDCECAPLDVFIREQEQKGERFNYMHILIAGIVRGIALYPRLNRFVMNGRIFARKGIFISFVVKKRLNFTASDSLVKLEFTGHETLLEVRDKVDQAIIDNARTEANNNTDKAARLLTFTPNIVLKILMRLIKWMDRHGLIPNVLLKMSPFHTSAFVSNLKSIKGPSIYHHLYEFGTTGLFFAMGKESADTHRMPVEIVMDERFCDGFYYVRALNELKRLMENPQQLLTPLETLPEDVEVADPYRFFACKK